jgi:hypothetical protein
MSFYPASSRTYSATGLITVCLLAALSACQRPVAHFQRSNREVFYSPAPKPLSSERAEDLSADSPAESGEKASGEPIPTEPALAYAEASRPAESTGNTANGPLRQTYPLAERIREHQSNARRLLTPVTETSSDTPSPISEHQPGPKPKKTLREILGLPPRKKLNWWQRISWQLKAAFVLILVAVVFAILNITILAIIFGVISAFLLIRGLKKSFKVRRGIFGLGI